MGDFRCSKDFFIGMHFRRLLHVDKFHLHLMGPPEEGRAFDGNAARTQASRVREGKALAITCVKRFDFEACRRFARAE